MPQVTELDTRPRYQDGDDEWRASDLTDVDIRAIGLLLIQALPTGDKAAALAIIDETESFAKKLFADTAGVERRALAMSLIHYLTRLERDEAFAALGYARLFVSDYLYADRAA